MANEAAAAPKSSEFGLVSEVELAAAAPAASATGGRGGSWRGAGGGNEKSSIECGWRCCCEVVGIGFVGICSARAIVLPAPTSDDAVEHEHADEELGEQSAEQRVPAQGVGGDCCSLKQLDVSVSVSEGALPPVGLVAPVPRSPESELRFERRFFSRALQVYINCAHKRLQISIM